MRSVFHFAFAVVVGLSPVACADDVTEPTSPTAQVSASKDRIGRVPPPPTGDFIAIVAGNDHTCARRDDGRVYCWGLDNWIQSGGGGRPVCSGLSCVDQPRLVLTGATSIAPENAMSAGSNHTCVLVGTGSAICWGAGGNGQLGFQNGVYSESGPVPVAGTRRFTSIGAGSTSTCATSTIGLFCWGTIANQVNMPVLISNIVFSRVGVANLHVCGFNADNTGVVRCQGRNDYGEAGAPLGQPQTDFNQRAFFGWDDGITRFSMEDNYTCVEQPVSLDVQCIGLNGWGVLGDGTTNTGNGLVSVGGGMELHGVTTGPVHACALDPSGQAWCWGNGNNGQLGNGVFGVFPSPQLVNSPVPFRALAAGGQHTCGIGTDNHIYCWGRNHFGNVGIHDPNNGWFPNPVQAIDPIS